MVARATVGEPVRCATCRRRGAVFESESVHAGSNDGSNALPDTELPPDMSWQDHIETSPEVLTGKPVVRGTRIPVELVIDLLGQGWEIDALLEQYPALQHADICACLQYASERLKSERVYPFEPDAEDA
jgi:uncharacterized protein (DUF433 family)